MRVGNIRWSYVIHPLTLACWKVLGKEGTTCHKDMYLAWAFGH